MSNVFKIIKKASTEAATRGVSKRCIKKRSIKKVFLKLLQNSWKNTCVRPATLSILTTRLWHRCFSVNFGKYFRILFVQNISRRLLLPMSNDFILMLFLLVLDRFQYFFEIDYVIPFMILKMHLSTVTSSGAFRTQLNI